MENEYIVRYFDSVALRRDFWLKRNSYYHNELMRLLKFLVPECSSVLDVGSSTGNILNTLNPKIGVGIDISSVMVKTSQIKYPHLNFFVQNAEDIQIKEKFDYVLISGSLGVFSDIWKVFRSIRRVVTEESRVVITYYNGLWEPILKLAEKIRLRMPRPYQNWFGLKDIDNLLYLNGYEVVKQGKILLFPINIPIVSWFFNRILANLPIINNLCLIEYAVAKAIPLEERKDLICSVIAPCRNEVGNILPLLERLPVMGKRTEVIFVDGYSIDGTVEKIEKSIAKYKSKFDIKLIHQIPRHD